MEFLSIAFISLVSCFAGMVLMLFLETFGYIIYTCFIFNQDKIPKFTMITQETFKHLTDFSDKIEDLFKFVTQSKHKEEKALENEEKRKVKLDIYIELLESFKKKLEVKLDTGHKIKLTNDYLILQENKIVAKAKEIGMEFTVAIRNETLSNVINDIDGFIDKFHKERFPRSHDILG